MRNSLPVHVHGLGAIQSQIQEDKKFHPVAYASRTLSNQEKGMQ